MEMLYEAFLAVLTVASFAAALDIPPHMSPALDVQCTKNSDNINFTVERCNTTNKVIIKIRATDLVNLNAPLAAELVNESLAEKNDYEDYYHGYGTPSYEDSNLDLYDVTFSHPFSLPTEESHKVLEKVDVSNSWEEEKQAKLLFCKEEEDVDDDSLLTQQGSEVHAKYELIPGLGLYRFHTQPLAWEDARRVCEREDAHLAVLNSQDEADVFVAIMRRCPTILSTHFNSYAYLGLHDNFFEGKFETVYGEPLAETGYVKWAHNQPDNAHHVGENCITMNRQGFYNDVPCYVKLPFFCEAN